LIARRIEVLQAQGGDEKDDEGRCQ
jgi:hypothetical protein